MLDIEEIKSRLQDFESRNDEIKDIEKDIEEANTVLRNDRREFETEFADIIAGASTNPIRNEQKNTAEAELNSRKNELSEIRDEFQKQKDQLEAEFNQFRTELIKGIQEEKDKLNKLYEKVREADNAEQFGMTEGERVERIESLRKEIEHIESIKKEKEQLIADREKYINRIAEWENNNVDPRNVIYRRLKEETLPSTDLRISEIDQELEKVKDRDIDKEIADELEILEFNPETYNAQYNALENYEKDIQKINVYDIDNQLKNLREIFEVKSQEELRQEAEEEARKESEAERKAEEEAKRKAEEEEARRKAEERRQNAEKLLPKAMELVAEKLENGLKILTAINIRNRLYLDTSTAVDIHKLLREKGVINDVSQINEEKAKEVLEEYGIEIEGQEDNSQSTEDTQSEQIAGQEENQGDRQEQESQEGHSSQGIEDTPSETAEGQENEGQETEGQETEGQETGGQETEGQETEGQENSSARKKRAEIDRKIAKMKKEAEVKYPNAIGYIIGVLRNKKNKFNRIPSIELTENLNLTNSLVATKIKQKLQNDGILRGDRVLITEEEAINILKELGREDLIPKEMEESTDTEHQTQGNPIQIDEFNNELNRTRQQSAVQGPNEGEHVEGEKAELDKVQEQLEKQGKYEELVNIAINKLADCLKAGKAKFNVDEEFKEMNLDQPIRLKIYEKLVQMDVIDELEFINEEQAKKVLEQYGIEYEGKSIGSEGTQLSETQEIKEIEEQRRKISSILSGKGFKINIGKTGIIERERMKRIAPDVDMKRGAYLNYEYDKDNNSDDDIRRLAENYYLKDISNLITKCHANNVPIDFTIIESIRSKNIIIEEKEKDALIKAYLTNMLISHYNKTQAKDLEEYKDAKKFDELEITYDMKDLSKPIPLHKALLICIPFIGKKFLKKDLSASDKIRIVNLAEKAKEYNVGKIKGSYKYNDNSLSAKILRLFKHDTKLLPAPPVPETRNKKLSQKLQEDYPISSSNRELVTEEPSKGEVDRGVDEENIVDSEKE